MPVKFPWRRKIKSGTFLSCDECGYRSQNVYHGSPRQVRKQARRNGWSYKNGKDICLCCNFKGSKK